MEEAEGNDLGEEEETEGEDLEGEEEATEEACFHVFMSS